MDRAADLRADYDRLGDLLSRTEGGAAAAIAHERRMIGELLESLERPVEVSKVDELAVRRAAAAGPRRAASRRSKSG